jgi:CSLREA domain-containing protein
MALVGFALAVVSLAVSGGFFAPSPVAAAVIEVDTEADNATAGDGDCTLREAINNANSDSDTTGDDCEAGTGVDSIVFAAG